MHADKYPICALYFSKHKNCGPLQLNHVKNKFMLKNTSKENVTTKW